jgi:hypothetical protein
LPNVQTNDLETQGAQWCYGKDAKNYKFCTHVPHIEGEEVFGSQNRKLDMPLGDKQKSHRPNWVNFICLQVETRSTWTRVGGCSLTNIQAEGAFAL